MPRIAERPLNDTHHHTCFRLSVFVIRLFITLLSCRKHSSEKKGCYWVENQDVFSLPFHNACHLSGWCDFTVPRPFQKAFPRNGCRSLPTIISKGCPKSNVLRHAQTKRRQEWNTFVLSLLSGQDGRSIKRFPTRAVPSSGYNNYSATSQRGMISYCIISPPFFFFFFWLV